MRKFIYMLLFCLLLTGCAGIDTLPKDVVVTDADLGISQVRQLVAEDNSTGRTIMWRSEAEQNYVLQYRKAGTQKVSDVKAENSSFSDGDTRYILYRVSLTELGKGGEYEYRIGVGQKLGQWHRLQLDKGADFTAVVFPDSQSADYSGWTRLARGAMEKNHKASLYISMGDLVDNGADGSQWRTWFSSVEPFSDRVPLAPVIGNHETYSLEYKFRLPQAYTRLFALPPNRLSKYPNQFYSFDFGDVHFTVVDTNFYELRQLQPKLLDDQLEWLEQDLAKAKAKWKVVLQHRDVMIYGFGPESGRPRTKTRFDDEGYWLMPIYEKYGVDAVLSAHLHTYRRRVPIRNYKEAADGITYILTGVAGDVRYPKLWGEGWLDAATAPQPETANYMTMESTKDRLVFRAFLEDGRQFDSVELVK